MEQLSGADAWYLYMEGPTVPLHVTGLLLLDPSTAPSGFSFAALRRYVDDRLDLMPMLLRRLVEVPLDIDHPSWIEDPDFDLDEHLHHHVMDPPGTKADLTRFIGEFTAERLDRSRPLWNFTLVEGLDDSTVAIVMKMHHCVVDGVSGMDFLSSLLDLTPEVAPRERESEPRFESVPAAAEMAVQATWNRLSDPLRPVRAAWDAAGSLVRTADTAIRRRLDGEDAVAHPLNAPRTRFNASITGNRVVAFGLAPLDDLKAIRRAFDVKINDVVLAVCTHALRRYLETHDEIPERPLVCSVPVSTHGAASQGHASNQVSNMFVNLPVHLDDPVEQLEVIRAGSLGAKQIQDSIGADMISDVVEMIPASMFHLATRVYSEMGGADLIAPVHNLIISNVVGSPIPVYLAGAQVVGMIPFGPLLEGTGLNITVLSNNGELNIGLIGCPEVLPDVEGLLDAVLDGVAVLLDAAEKVS